MDIGDIRKIGERLKREVPPFIETSRGSEPIARGASGDMTYTIDKKAEDIVFEEAEKLRKPLTIISEEYGFKDLKGGGSRLLVDPVDGSKNAISGLPVFSTSIALVDGETLWDTRIGYIINLVNGDEFWALKGRGCFYNGVRVKTQRDAEFKVIVYEAQTPKTDIPKVMPVLSLFRRTRCLGSIAIDMALLAQGAVSMFINPAPSRSFDFASGFLLVREAGGIVTDLEGEDIGETPVGIEKTTPVLASGNEELHKKALETLKSKS
jgi:myo-inositol-1(or 4)-monophosphatase